MLSSSHPHSSSLEQGLVGWLVDYFVYYSYKGWLRMIDSNSTDNGEGSCSPPSSSSSSSSFDGGKISVTDSINTLRG